MISTILSDFCKRKLGRMLTLQLGQHLSFHVVAAAQRGEEPLPVQRFARGHCGAGLATPPPHRGCFTTSGIKLVHPGPELPGLDDGVEGSGGRGHTLDPRQRCGGWEILGGGSKLSLRVTTQRSGRERRNLSATH